MTYARIPITNVYADGDYTGRFLMGADRKPLNVLLDTGSSALAIDATKYEPDVARGDELTNLAQMQGYDDKSHWAGAVIKTQVRAGHGKHEVTLAGGNVAVAYEASRDMFGVTDGILGLAYAKLDEAYKMPEPTWPRRYTANQIKKSQTAKLAPYLTQLAKQGVVSDKVSFYTLRSAVHAGGGALKDPLNQGWLIIGGGEEAKDLYTGRFQVVKVLADDWYSTNLKSVKVGDQSFHLRARGRNGSVSNSIIDSGTNAICLPKNLLNAMFAEFPATQRDLLKAAVFAEAVVSAAKVRREQWPDLTFVLQGEGREDVALRVPARDYWQLDADRVGSAVSGLSVSSDSSAILGLPLMNGYFTIFDGEADHGRGVIKFATAIRG